MDQIQKSFIRVKGHKVREIDNYILIYKYIFKL